VALHLTRPAVLIPDRAKLGMASHFEAARGAYLLRDFRPGAPRHGTVFIQGTSTTANLVSILPKLDEAAQNVRIVAVISPQLFNLQDEAYRNAIAGTAERWDAMCITNRSLRTMSPWIANPVVAEYSLASDWDNRWRTGGSLEEVVDEAHLGPSHILEGIKRFAAERGARLAKLRSAVDAASR
jgi:transketolase